MKPRDIPVIRIPYKRTTPESLAGKMSGLVKQVRERAYEILSRGREGGRYLDYWLQAEYELGMLPFANIDETETEIRLRIESSDFRADQLKVYAESGAISVAGAGFQRTESDKSKQMKVIERSLFGRYELPSMIDAGWVTATLQNGILEIAARKAELPVEANPVTGGPVRGRARHRLPGHDPKAER